jgi:arylsulfatase A-like enzyme
MILTSSLLLHQPDRAVPEIIPCKSSIANPAISPIILQTMTDSYRTKKKTPSLIAGALLLALCSVSAEKKPNILFVLTDDLGWGDLGVFFQNQRADDRRFGTPALDRMAAEGIQMRSHYAPAPVCAPSRASLLTGRHQGHEEVRNNEFDKALSTSHNLATVLKEGGYRTVLVGKYGFPGGDRNLYEMDKWTAYPTRRGFDEFYGAVKHKDGHSQYPANPYPRGDDELHRGTFPLYHNDKQLTKELEGAYTTDLFTAFAKKWIVDHREKNADQPFFMFLSHTTPHAALHLPSMAYPEGGGLKGGVQWIGESGKMINTVGGDFDAWIHPDFAQRDWTEQEKRFATMVRRIDDTMADLIQTLKDLGIDENTIIVFTSDNGPHKESYLIDLDYKPTSFASYGPFSGIKRDVLEGGIRVPTLVRWPGKIPDRQINQKPSQFHDWMPTLAKIAGLPAPAISDGVSLLPILTGKGEAQESTVYVEYFVGEQTPEYREFDPLHRGSDRKEMQAIFMDGYKGFRRDIKSHADDFMIFDLKNDPKELRDLSKSPDFDKGLQQRMKDRVLQIRRPIATAPRPYDKEPVPALAIDFDAKITWSLYASKFPWVPQTHGSVASQTGSMDAVSLEGTNAAAGNVIEFKGHIRADDTGTHSFNLESSGAAILRVHEVSATSGSIILEKGVHPFALTVLVGTEPKLNFDFKSGK